MKALIKTLMLLAVLIVASPTYALSGELGNWIRNDSGPALARIIRDEPRFLGETISIVALRDGQPGNIDTQLETEIANELRQQLLRHQGIRIPLVGGIGNNTDCHRPPSGIVLGIQIDRADRSQHHVLLALLDLEENIWINQSPRRWTGRLDSEHSRLLARPAGQQVRALIASDHENIASALIAQLQCRQQLAEPLYIEPLDHPVRQFFQRKLGAITALTDNQLEAGSVLTINTQLENAMTVSLGSGTGQVRLAEVALTRSAPQAQLLSNITLDSRRTECRGQGRHCVDIEYELLDDAFVFEFFTRKGRVVSLACDLEPAPRFGPVRKGLKIPKSDSPRRPSLGYYVLATQNPSVARRLAHDLSALSSNCESHTTTPDTPAQLGSLASWAINAGVNWQALHLVNRRGRINTL